MYVQFCFNYYLKFEFNTDFVHRYIFNKNICIFYTISVCMEVHVKYTFFCYSFILLVNYFHYNSLYTFLFFFLGT